MKRTARIQAWSTLVAILILPVLYFGGMYDVTLVSAIGLIVFTASMLTCPVLRFVAVQERATGHTAAAADSLAVDTPDHAH